MLILQLAQNIFFSPTVSKNASSSSKTHKVKMCTFEGLVKKCKNIEAHHVMELLKLFSVSLFGLLVSLFGRCT